jgi:hypothetical protein
MRSYKKKKECPPALTEWIELYNFLQQCGPLVNFEKILRREQARAIRKAKKEGLERPETRSLSEVFQRCLNGKPPELEDRIRSEARKRLYPASPGAVIVMERKHLETHFMVNVYIEYCAFFASMTGLMQKLEQERIFHTFNAQTKEALGESYDSQLATWAGWERFPLVVDTVIERVDGKLTARPSGLVGLLGTFDDSRLRRCAVCRKVFWAKRSVAETCGEKECADTLGNRKRSKKATNGR